MLCCCDKRTAHVAVALLSLLIFLFQILRSIEVWLSADWGLRGPYKAPIALMVLGILGICVTALDGYGIMKERAGFMMPFLVYMIMQTIVVGLAALVYLLTMDSPFRYNNTNSSSFIVGCFLAVGLNIYFCTAVSSHIKEVKTKSALRADAKNNGRLKHKESSEHIDDTV